MKKASGIASSCPDWVYYGGDGDCPHCKEIDALESPVKKGGFLWVVDRHTVSCVVDFRTCAACSGCSYAVTLELIANPDVSEEFRQTYFVSDEPKPGRTTVFTMKPRWKIRGLPKEWLVTEIETPAGILQRHFFGPFPDLKGRGAWALNGSKGPWKHAAWILCRVGQRLTKKGGK